jgi:hypothetical protein
MKLEIVRKLIGHTQNMGSNEDVVTAALATAFDYCPEFMRQLFIELGLEEYKFENNGKCLPTLESGSVIQSKYYKWLERTDINFKPDLVITKSKFWVEDKDNPPTGDEVIIVESKLFKADLDEVQEEQYRLFKQELLAKGNIKIQMILISIHDYKEKETPKLFDKVVTWDEVIEKSKKILNNLKTSKTKVNTLHDLTRLISFKIGPPKEDLKNGSGFCSRKILSELKMLVWSQRIKDHCESIDLIGPKKIFDSYYDKKDYEYLIKRLQKHAINERDLESSYIIFKPKSDNLDSSISDQRFYLNCLMKGKKAIFWIEFDVRKDEKDDIVPLGTINFQNKKWKDEWISLAEFANSEIQDIL